MKNFFLHYFAIFIISYALIFFPENAIALEGKVIKIADGDTITILTDDQEQIKIRLYGIDCPERRQPFGSRARDFTSSALAGKRALVEEKGKDRYGRVVGIVRTEDRESINERLLSSGLAWVYEQYCRIPLCNQWKILEENARATGKGLWKDKNPVQPWIWRKHKKQR